LHRGGSSFLDIDINGQIFPLIARHRLYNNEVFRLSLLQHCLCGEDSLDDFENLDFTALPRLCFSFTIDFEQARAFRKANGDYLRKHQFKDLIVDVYI